MILFALMKDKHNADAPKGSQKKWGYLTTASMLGISVSPVIAYNAVDPSIAEVATAVTAGASAVVYSYCFEKAVFDGSTRRKFKDIAASATIVAGLFGGAAYGIASFVTSEFDAQAQMLNARAERQQYIKSLPVLDPQTRVMPTAEQVYCSGHSKMKIIVTRDGKDFSLQCP